VSSNSASTIPISVSQIKKDKRSSKTIRKTGVFFKEGKPLKFRKYNAVLKDGKLTMALASPTEGAEKRGNTSMMMDLLLAQPIDVKEVKEVACKEPANFKLFTVDIVTESRKDLIGFETKEDLDDWVDTINKSIHALRGKKKKKLHT